MSNHSVRRKEEAVPKNRHVRITDVMSEKARPKFSFSRKLGGGEFLNVAVWPGRSNPEDEVVSVQLRKFDGDWTTLARIALYRTRDGTYSELPERTSTQSGNV
jgi:hypothetical protein